MTAAVASTAAVKSSRRVEGKVAIVSGAGMRSHEVGNGAATSILLARAGASVVVADHDREAANRTVSRIHSEGGIAAIAIADIAVEAEARSVVDVANTRFGGVDILVNNVGIAGPAGTAITVEVHEWSRGLAINVTSMMLMSRYALPVMLGRGAGSIVNIASVAGLEGGHPGLFYPTSKGAVVAMTRAMAAHHGRDGVRVNCVAPGMVWSPMVSSKPNVDERYRTARRERSLLGTEGTPWDTAFAVVYLASDEAKWLTGVVLPVDGGASAGRTPGERPHEEGFGTS